MYADVYAYVYACVYVWEYAYVDVHAYVDVCAHLYTYVTLGLCVHPQLSTNLSCISCHSAAPYASDSLLCPLSIRMLRSHRSQSSPLPMIDFGHVPGMCYTYSLQGS